MEPSTFPTLMAATKYFSGMVSMTLREEPPQGVDEGDGRR